MRRVKKIINFDPVTVENPLFTFLHDKVVIYTEEGVVLTVDERPKKKRRRPEDDDNEDQE